MAGLATPSLPAALSSMPFISGLPSKAPVDLTGSLTPSLDAVVSLTPLTRSQQAIWLDYTLHPRGTLYNLTLKATLTDGDDSYDGSLGAVIKGLSRSSQKKTYFTDLRLAQQFIRLHSATPRFARHSILTPCLTGCSWQSTRQTLHRLWCTSLLELRLRIFLPRSTNLCIRALTLQANFPFAGLLFSMGAPSTSI